MDRMQSQENLAHLVHVEALLGKLTSPAAASRAVAKTAPILHSPGLELTTWPLGALCNETLSSKLKVVVREPFAPVVALQLPTPPVASDSPLTNVLEIITKDIMASRDRLLLLNPGRRKMIEHRLEFIARRIARTRGEKLTRSLSLTEVLKESYRDNAQAQTKVLGNLAWKAFVTEVALYNILELFLLKCLDVYGWRKFEDGDLGRLNFAANMFLSQRGTGFAHDKHCWNFARTNLYSWYVPSRGALENLSPVLSRLTIGWTDEDLMSWMNSLPESLRLPNRNFEEEHALAESIVDLIEKQLGTPVASNFQGQAACRKFFVPALEDGGVALALLDRMLSRVRTRDGSDWLNNESNQLHRALWACESESFEAFWTEAVALLKLLRSARSNTDWSTPDQLGRLPHATHVVQLLGLELHNLEQLPLGGPEVSKLHQGSAAQIQQIETFDVAVVTDHADRTKSARWMKALAEQLPYWRGLVSGSSNLNWGELHLHLALSKLKENGHCVYLSHRVLPEGGDGERLRKLILGMATLEAFIELNEESYRPYRYIYIFRRESNKHARDTHRARFGHVKQLRGPIVLTELEEANSTQVEIMDRGWDHLFVRGAAPLVRHLNHKFPKLFQIATIQAWSDGADSPQGFFGGGTTRALEISMASATDPMSGVTFTPVTNPQAASPATVRDRLFLFPHNPVDLPWIQAILHSTPAQFWIRHQVLNMTAGKTARLADLRSCPIVDLSHAPSDAVHDALEWLGQTKPDAALLAAWAGRADSPITDRHAKYVAMAKRYSSLERIVARYRPLFNGTSFEELRPEAVTQFYPAALLCYISQSPDVRIQYAGRERCNILPENWTIQDVQVVIQTVSGKPCAFIVAYTRQGPTIQIAVPVALREYVGGQMKQLRGHTWGEALSMLRLPRDVSLFAAQASEIVRVVHETAREMAVYQKALEDLALELFEISPEVRQFLPH